ncbi:MAG: helix-hairpin-helix domain-containing protein [Bacilli bacterium]|nr:helix-hairpin-helix domain-containing protein [Bacilli bacterium]
MIGMLLSLNIMFCDIKGEVNNPGVYQVNNNNIMDIIELAGGITKNANVNKINLSKIVHDEMVILIPSKNEKKLICPVCKCPEIKCSEPKIEISTTIPITTTKLITTTKYITTTKNELININTANIEELTTLNGIGEVIANRIISYRINSPFIAIEEIMKVQGIGPNLFAKIKDYIII